ncbi:hypothetical protein Btru_035608 [Bulinus truncatus]|nr:hypothetical protein Btru_035608 [Bulinus truncatus]
MSGHGGQQNKASNDNKSSQCNPNNSCYQGHQTCYTGTGTTPDLNNHGNQLNPNNSTCQPKK